ncbi:hypothetical protein AAG570_006913 [Ranatra chinensis]|uniref:Uncharacterized protein n=1 Tax=Ranatra chinensis TaxID=642074 RepID=A0ABD0YVF8_9HEMI
MASKRRNTFQKNKTQETTENEGTVKYVATCGVDTANLARETTRGELGMCELISLGPIAPHSANNHGPVPPRYSADVDCAEGILWNEAQQKAREKCGPPGERVSVRDGSALGQKVFKTATFCRVRQVSLYTFGFELPAGEETREVHCTRMKVSVVKIVGRKVGNRTQGGVVIGFMSPIKTGVTAPRPINWSRDSKFIDGTTMFYDFSRGGLISLMTAPVANELQEAHTKCSRSELRVPSKEDPTKGSSWIIGDVDGLKGQEMVVLIITESVRQIKSNLCWKLRRRNSRSANWSDC